MEQQPLLTHEQLVDWLIYHCPLINTSSNDYPFKVMYQSTLHGMRFMTLHCDPRQAYEETASRIPNEPNVHREITDLYWYWTI